MSPGRSCVCVTFHNSACPSVTDASVQLGAPAPQAPPASAAVQRWRLPIVLASLAILWAARFPETAIRVATLRALGSPRYEGFVGLFLPHMLLYSTTSAACAFILWIVLARLGVVPAPRFPVNRAVLSHGLVVGLLASALTAVVVFLMAGAGAFHWVGLNGWKIAGNLFSNFFEELIFRGFVLTALGAVIGFWPAALASSIWWAATHVQYPLPLRACIAAVGLLFCWELRRTKSVIAPYISHQTLDVILDSVIG